MQLVAVEAPWPWAPCRPGPPGPPPHAPPRSRLVCRRVCGRFPSSFLPFLLRRRPGASAFCPGAGRASAGGRVSATCEFLRNASSLSFQISLIVASAGHVSSFRKSTRALQGELSEAASARAFSPRPRVSVLPRTPAPRGFPLGTLRLSPHAVPSAGTAGTAARRAEAEPENSQHEAGAPTHSEGVGGPGDRAAGSRGAAPSVEGDPGMPRPAPATALPRQWEGAAWSQPPQVSPRAVQSVKTLGGPRPVIRGDSELEEPREPASSMCGHVRGAHLHPKP